MPAQPTNLERIQMKYGNCPRCCGVGSYPVRVGLSDFDRAWGAQWAVQLRDCSYCEGTGSWPWPRDVRKTQEDARAYLLQLQRTQREWYFTRLWRVPRRGLRVAARVVGRAALQSALSGVRAIRARGVLGSGRRSR